MKIVTNNNISKDKTSPYFAEKFSYYTRQEIEDFAKLYNYRTYNYNWKNSSITVYSNIVWNERGAELYFKFEEKHPGSDNFYLADIQSDYTYVSRPFFKNMALTLEELFEAYKQKYAEPAAKYELKRKETETARKINDINTDEIELDFMTLAEKYGYEFTSEHPCNPAAIYNTYKFVNKGNSLYKITFDSFTVKSKNVQCWEINAYWPFTKDEYCTYVGTYDAIKQVAEGYMKMFEKPVMTNCYDYYIIKK
jgi:hypothetical protein